MPHDRTPAPSAPSRPAALSEDGGSIVLDRYVQFFIGAISNKLLRISTKVYAEKFGVTLNDWRTMAMLAVESDITATRICEVIGFDKAAVSRSIRSLEERGYLTTRPVDTHNRARLVALTTGGRAVHDAIMEMALAREDRLLDGLTDPERLQLLKALRRMYQNAGTILTSVEQGGDGS